MIIIDVVVDVVDVVDVVFFFFFFFLFFLPLALSTYNFSNSLLLHSSLYSLQHFSMKLFTMRFLATVLGTIIFARSTLAEIDPIEIKVS